MTVRRRLYLCWFAIVVLMGALPGVLYPHIIDVSLHHRPALKVDAVIARIYDGPTAWPVWTYRSIGGSIALPFEWSPELRMGLTLSMILVPFWFLVGVPFLELILLFRRGRHTVSREVRT